MTRLRRSDSAGRGFARVRRGRGFSYVDEHGQPISDPDVRARIEALVLPPAWKDVWICPWPNGHIQATGVDAAGRRQYRYHDVWRTNRDRAKHARLLEGAARLPAACEVFAADLAETDSPAPGCSRRRRACSTSASSGSAPSSTRRTTARSASPRCIAGT